MPDRPARGTNSMGRILLVDDNDDSRFAVVETIRKLAGHAVDEARSGAECLERVRQAAYDLVLLDVQMPGMDGFEVCRLLRADPATRQVPVLFLTATQYQLESRLKGLDLGADDFIVQPVGNQELVARIKAALRVKALSDEVRSHNLALESKVRERTRTIEELAAELRAERDTLRETFDVFDQALLLVDVGGRVLVANAAGRRLGETALAPDLVALAVRAVSAGAVCDGTLADAGRSYSARAFPLRAARGEGGGGGVGGRALLNVRDVTDARDDELRRLQAEKLASIGMLAAGVAHEINNPAAFVLGNIESLGAHLRMVQEKIEGIDPGVRANIGELLFEATAILQESKEGMARIHRIVRDLSSFAHVDDDKGTLVTVNAAVESTLTMLRNELRHRATVHKELSAARAVRGSPARLAQVFLNVIINAAQALVEPDPQTSRIVVRTYDQGDDVVFEVTDNGPGIAPDVLPRIFDSFFTTKPRGVGTGLGLPISQGIVRDLGGEITVESQLDRGTTFRVRLPAAAAARGEAGLDEPPAPEYRRRRVLAVDDEALLLKAYRRMLSDVHDVVTALGGRDAMRVLAERQDFDVVLCDLQMPEMSGMELYAAVKERHGRLADRFVFVTGGAFSVDAKRFLEQAITCINKPFRIEELLAIIEDKAADRGAGVSAPEVVVVGAVVGAPVASGADGERRARQPGEEPALSAAPGPGGASNRRRLD
jgi:signal transduction histidine kinase